MDQDEAFQRMVEKGGFDGMNLPRGVRVLGVDPGIIGGWAIVSDVNGELVACGDLPIAGEGAQRMVSAPLFSAVLDAFMPDYACVELVSAMPKQGVSSSFKFGRAVGVIEGVIGGANVPITWVSAAKWKRDLRLNADKEASRQRAIQNWPAKAKDYFARKKDHGRAEAALIARYLVEALWANRFQNQRSEYA